MDNWYQIPVPRKYYQYNNQIAIIAGIASVLIPRLPHVRPPQSVTRPASSRTTDDADAATEQASAAAVAAAND